MHLKRCISLNDTNKQTKSSGQRVVRDRGGKERQSSKKHLNSFKKRREKGENNEYAGKHSFVNESKERKDA